MSKKMIKDFKTGDQVAVTLIVKSKRQATTRANKLYLDLDLIDKSGQISAKVWDRAVELGDCFQRGDVVKVKGMVEEFMGKPQLKIIELRPMLKDEPVDWESLLKCTPQDPAKMMEYLDGEIEAMKDPHLKALLASMFADPDFKAAFIRSAAARNVHHVYQGGLLEHTANVTRLAAFACDRMFRGKVDRDLTVAGAILHDVGKARELDSRIEIGYTAEGYMVGHVVLGSAMVRKAAEKVDGFPEGLLMELDHIILSHHGEKEWGSPVVPLTPEAMIVHNADNMDAKTQIVLTAIADDPNDEEEFTQYHRTLARHFYKRRERAEAIKASFGEGRPSEDEA